MKILFWGTPREAVPFLEACADRHAVVGAVTRPPRPSGRGLQVRPSPVEEAARNLGIPVFQPSVPGELLPEMNRLAPDICVVVAYGKILKPDVLASARKGFMNVHFSLLPKFRGAAPVPWTLIRGEDKAGVTLFWLDEGMDTGPVQSALEVPVGPDENAVELMRGLIEAGRGLLRETLEDISRGSIRREPQTGEASLAPKLTRADARVDFNVPARDLHNRVRGLAMGPRAFLPLAGGDVAILRTAVEPDSPAPSDASPPGTIARVERGRGVLVQCASGRIRLIDVQPEGKRQIQAADFANGLRLGAGGRFCFHG